MTTREGPDRVESILLLLALGLVIWSLLTPGFPLFLFN